MKEASLSLRSSWDGCNVQADLFLMNIFFKDGASFWYCPYILYISGLSVEWETRISYVQCPVIQEYFLCGSWLLVKGDLGLLKVSTKKFGDITHIYQRWLSFSTSSQCTVYLQYTDCELPLQNILIISGYFLYFNVAIPRQNIVRDIFGYVEFGLTTPRLVEECPDLLTIRPATQEIQVARIRAIPVYRYDSLNILVLVVQRAVYFTQWINCDPGD